MPNNFPPRIEWILAVLVGTEEPIGFPLNTQELPGNGMGRSGWVDGYYY
jgi:hypothetical protein